MKSKTYIIKITGKNQICSFINKKSTLDQTKQLVSALADTMDWPKTLMVFENTGLEDVKVFEYIKNR